MFLVFRTGTVTGGSFFYPFPTKTVQCAMIIKMQRTTVLLIADLSIYRITVAPPFEHNMFSQHLEENCDYGKHHLQIIMLICMWDIGVTYFDTSKRVSPPQQLSLQSAMVRQLPLLRRCQ